MRSTFHQRLVVPAPRSLALLGLLALLLAAPALGASSALQQDTQQQEEEAEATGLRALAVKMGEEGLVAPTIVERVNPEYTPAAKSAGIEGDVYIEAVVTDEGKVAEPKLIRGIGHESLDEAALAAIIQWRFEPGTKEGEPVHVIALFTVTFRIR